jgi:amino acid adenylation domain-containing protein
VIVKRFEEIADGYGDKVAIKGGDIHLTYHGLNSLVNRLARMILHLYPGAGLPLGQHTVGLLLEPGIEGTVAVLAALKARKIYVPFDPTYPVQRLEYMLRHFDIRLLVTDNQHMEIAKTLTTHASEKIALLNIQHPDPNVSSGNLELEAEPDQPAYILQTSGSKGYPKGVVQTCGNLFFFTDRYIDALHITPGDRISFLSSFYHDGTVEDIYPALLSGAALYPFNIRRKGAAEIADWLIKERITVYHSVPTVFRYFAGTLSGESRFPGLRVICMGAEPLRQDDLRIIREHFPCTLLAHMYGQTESSVNTMGYIDVQETNAAITLGTPPEGVELLVLNEEGEEVEELETGEIVVVSKHIAAGYWKDPEATAKAFLYDEELGRMYRSGDLGEIDYDGSIRFMGRKDHQVKIRGFRVELGEIENRLLEHQNIKEAAVTMGENNAGDYYLCAYIVTNGAAVKKPGLGDYLARFLPDYMIPSYFVQLEKMPLTASGKVNRRALPVPETMTTRAEGYEAPGNPIEEMLVNLWSEVLGVEKHLIGVTDNFFELGGHSLKGTVLAAKIYKAFHVKIPLAEILNTPFIRGTASKIREAGQSKFLDIEAVEKKEYYELSYNQKRLWIIHTLNPNGSSYHIPGWIPLNHAVNIEALKKVLSRIFVRHEGFRTGFKELQDQPVQFIYPTVEVPFRVFNISTLKNSEKQQKTMEIFTRTVTQPFDLEKPPLFRSVLIKQDDEAYVFVYNMHHIISDGWSNDILRSVFQRLYEDYSKGSEVCLEPVQYHYKDFAGWHNRQIRDPELKEKALCYWKKVMESGFSGLKLPYFHSGEPGDSTGASYRCVIDDDIKNRLHRLAEDNNTTLFALLYTMFNLLLAYLSGEKEIVTTVISAGRDHPSLYNIVGYFINPVIIKIEVDIEADFEELLSRVNKNVLEAFQHQNYPFELVLEDLHIPFPNVSTAFNLLNMQDISREIELDSLESTHIEEKQDVKFDLVLYLTEYKNGIEINWRYQKSLFRPETIESIAGKYLQVMDEITGDQ